MEKDGYRYSVSKKEGKFLQRSKIERKQRFALDAGESYVGFPQLGQNLPPAFS
jgi:hypothetical protein